MRVNRGEKKQIHLWIVRADDGDSLLHGRNEVRIHQPVNPEQTGGGIYSAEPAEKSGGFADEFRLWDLADPVVGADIDDHKIGLPGGKVPRLRMGQGGFKEPPGDGLRPAAVAVADHTPSRPAEIMGVGAEMAGDEGRVCLGAVLCRRRERIRRARA